MFKTINLTLEDGTKKDFNFLAVGSTPYRFKQLFKQDLMKEMTKLVGSDLNSIGADADFSITDKLAFVMNCQAEKKDLTIQTFDSFLEWCDQFGADELLNHISDFVGIYLGNKESTSSPKKEVEP